MKRYIKPQIQVMAAVLTTEMLTGSEGYEVTTGMSKKNSGLFDDEWQSANESQTETDVTINSVWE